MIAAILLAELKKKSLSLGAVESFSGGAFSSLICSIPGASKVFKGSVVSYSPSIKVNVVGVNKETIDEEGVVSSSVAVEMARKGRDLLKVDICVSFTGDAGPTLEEGNDSLGRCFLGISTKEETISKEYHFKGSRNEIRNAAVDEMLLLIEEIINKKD